MATSSSSSFTYEWTYDVFISFRGEDTRSGFTGNLYKALCEKEVKPFKDDEDLEPGEEIGTALDKAIQESRIALVIFSKNYASSSFCLEELAKIVECSQDKGMWVCPVFYQVEPSDVRHQNGSYATALAKHETRFEKEKEKIDKWRNALKKVANFSGFSSDNYKYEHQFIDKIVQYISTKISSLCEGDKNEIICNLDDMYIAQHDKFEQPKPQTIILKDRGVEHLPVSRVHHNKDEKEKALASVYTGVPTNKIFQNKTSHKYRDFTTLKIAFHHANKNDVVNRTIRLSKQSAVGDVINDLKSKVDLSDPRAEVRLLGVSGHTTKIFSLDEKIENIINKYDTIRAEEICEVEENHDTGDKLIHVYHIKRHNGEIEDAGDEPFCLTINKDQKLIDIKLQIQQKLRVPYDKISKWRFATVRYNDAEYLEDLKYPDSVFNRFKRGSTYGDWEQYLGLEH